MGIMFAQWWLGRVLPARADPPHVSIPASAPHCHGVGYGDGANDAPAKDGKGGDGGGGTQAQARPAVQGREVHALRNGCETSTLWGLERLHAELVGRDPQEAGLTDPEAHQRLFPLGGDKEGTAALHQEELPAGKWMCQWRRVGGLGHVDEGKILPSTHWHPWGDRFCAQQIPQGAVPSATCPDPTPPHAPA